MVSTNLMESISKMQVRGMSKWILLATLLVMAAQSGEATEARVVCYYTNWSVYRPGTAKFNPQNINPYLCTHLIYAFGGFTKENTLKPFDKYQDIEKGGYAKFTGLKTYNQNLKTMIAIGGWNEGSTRFSPMVASSERRRELVKNVVKFMRLNKFDGLDLDWEYPAFRDGGKSKDRGNYAKLVQELREEFEKESQATGRPRLLLTMAVPAGIEYIDKGYDIPKLNRYLDWMNLLSYDYHSAFEPAVNHHSPLYALEAASEYNFDSELNIDFTIQHYLDAGADRDKLVLGIPTYGRSFTLFNPDSTAIGAPADGPGEQGEATREKGYLAYYEICESLLEKPRSKRQASDEDSDSEEDEYDEEDEPWTVVQPNPKAMGPYAFKGNQWVGYDDIDIVRKKAEYVAEKKLGGIMFWSIDNDDFRGKCHGKPYPLIEAAKESLYKSLGLADRLAPPKKQQTPTRKRTRPSKPSKLEEEDEKDISKNTVKNAKKRYRTETVDEQPQASSTTSRSSRRRENAARRRTSTAVSLTSGESTTPAWGLNTPEPPTTPDPGSDFKCTEEGFWPHPRDCKKYFWCLDSGPSNLGIVAHQFTCPSGLHFNKAADSCDFARNVLCNIKKVAATTAAPRTTTTTTTEAETTTRARFSTARSTTSTTTTTPKIPSRIASLFTTRRPIPRVTAATSSTTFLNRQSTTASPAEEEYEEIADELETDGVRGLQDEEDPKVIKELIDLIKKLGGVEQLEKHLAGSASTTGKGSQTTTPATISRLLYERVLSQARPTIGERAPPQQNSRGPQAAGLKGQSDEDKTVRRERPQYTTINRGRPPTRDPVKESEEEDEDNEDEDEEETKVTKASATTTSTSRPGLPQYVNIRRTRPSTTTESATSRNALFERESEESDDEDDDDDKNRVQSFEYATVSRFRPETSEVTTSKYKTIQRVRSTTEGSTTAMVKEINDSLNSQNSATDVPTEAPFTTSPVYTSPQPLQYASVSRLSSTSAPEIIDTTTLLDENNVATDINDVNVAIASPSFASENGVIKNADASVLNLQITTLSNTPSPNDETNKSFSASPVTYSTEITISEEPFTSTQRISTLFAKRTRPTTTTTAKPEEISESASTTKVSYERKYANVIRTRVPSSSSTSSSLLLGARFDNEIVSDSGKESSDEDFGRDNVLGGTSETTVKTKVGVLLRRIRSTTPASKENENEETEVNNGETDYGSRRFVRPQTRFTARRVRPVARNDGDNEETQSSVVINSESGQLSTDRTTTPRNVIRQPYRSRKFQLPNALLQAADNEESGNEFIGQTENFETTTILSRPQPIRRFRPSASSFESSDLSSLTALDISSRSRNAQSSQSTASRNAQVNRRFRPAFTTTTKEPIADSEDSDSSVAPVLTERPRISGFKPRGYGARTTAANNEPELNAEASEPSVLARGRKLSIARFPPRPFSRPTIKPAPVTESDTEDDLDLEEENELNAEIATELKQLGRARLTAPAIKVSEENNSQSSVPLKLALLGTATPKSGINVTKVISSNILLGKTNERNGILLLRRPSKLPNVASSTEKVKETSIQEESLENIHLSETNIEEKEHSEEVALDEENTLTSNAPRKRVIVKKLRSTTAALELSSTESTVSENGSLLIESTKLLQNAVDTVEKNEGQNDNANKRIRKILRRRPATTTTLGESSTTDKIQTNDIDDLLKVTESTDEEEITTTPIPRVRKIIRRKLKPALKEIETSSIPTVTTESSTKPSSSTIQPSSSTTESKSSTTEHPNEIETVAVSSTTESTDDIPENTEDPLDSDLLSEQTTVGAPSTKSKFDRPSYRPPKRPLNVITSTEAPTSTAKIYSRKYSNGPFTTPVLPSERDITPLIDRPRPEATPRRISLNPNRQFGRKPFTTARTTTTDEEEEDISEEELEVEEPENKLVFVPLDQLFTRAPVSKPQVIGRPPLKNNNDDEEENEEDNDEYESEEEDEEIPDNIKVTTTVRTINRFNSPQRTPGVLRGTQSNAREPNRPPSFNKPLGAKPATEEPGKRFNRPVAFQPNQRLNRFGSTTTSSPQESTSRGYKRKYSGNKSTLEPSSPAEEVNAEVVSAKNKQLFSNPKRFTTTTPTTPLEDDSTEEYVPLTTDANIDMATEISDTTEADTEVDGMTSTTEDSTTIDEMMISNVDLTTKYQEGIEETTVFDTMFDITNQPSSMSSIDLDESTTSSEKSTTEPHHIFAENIPGQSTAASTTKNSEESNTVYPNFASTTVNSSLDTTTVKHNDTEAFVKTSSQLDRLFAVSRVVEVNSKQETHRFNKKNESRLIETGELMQEKKPTLDKIGEVSRFTLIKIVEGDIPIYLTNLSHEYPVDNPPFNPIRIDEARNARALKNFSDSGIENLLTSESVSAAYNHRNAFVDYIEASIRSDSLGSNSPSNETEESTSIVDTTIATKLKSQPESSTSAYSIPPIQNRFVPGAIDLDERRNRKVDIVSPGISESSTIALEGLFKNDDVEQLSARNAGNSLNSGPLTLTQPFVVYAAPQDFSISKKHSVTESTHSSNNTSSDSDESSSVPSARSIGNFVKIQVLRPDDEKKGKEFLGVPAAVDAMLEQVNQPKSPITITILNQTDETLTNVTEVNNLTTSEPIVISLANLDGVVLKKVEGPNENSSTSTTLPETVYTLTTTERTNTTENIESGNLTTTEETITDSKISLLKIKPASITNGTLSKIAKKRPKLTFPRRSQTNQTKTSNITRISISPLANNQNRPISLDGKNIPYTTPKYNRTNSYTAGRSRFTANRVQNVPVDTRKQKAESNKFKPSNSTSDIIRVASPNPDSSKKVTIKPLRPGLLRTPSFVPRRATTVAPQVSPESSTQYSPESTGEIPSSDNALNSKFASENSQDQTGTTDSPVKIKPAFFPRRTASRFTLKPGIAVTTTEQTRPTQEPNHRFSSTGAVRRRPATVDRRRSTTSSPLDVGSATDAVSSTRAPNTRPTRVFVRKFFNQRSGANSTTPRSTLVATTTQVPEITSRRNFRIGVRRRPAILTTGGLKTTTEPATTTPEQTTVIDTSPETVNATEDQHDQEPHSSIQQVQEKETLKDEKEVANKKRIKIQKRPLTNGFRPNQLAQSENPSVTETAEQLLVKEVDRINTEKIYHSVIKDDHTLVQEEKIFNNKRGQSKFEDINGDLTADVAVAAHQLLSAPLPTIPSYASDGESDTHVDEIQFTRAYLMASSSSPIVSPNDFLSTPDRSRNKFAFPSKSRRISTTVAPRIVYTATTHAPVLRRRPEKPQPFEKINPVVKTYRKFVDYEYYDDDDVRVVAKNPNQQKVVVHGTGSIQCLDQGNFPHPDSCKMFISCAKMENGGVSGWAYTCPKGLSYDPVGGICNWSAGLGCQD